MNQRPGTWEFKLPRFVHLKGSIATRDTIPLTCTWPLTTNLHLTSSLYQDGFLVWVTQFVLQLPYSRIFGWLLPGEMLPLINLGHIWIFYWSIHMDEKKSIWNNPASGPSKNLGRQTNTACMPTELMRCRLQDGVFQWANLKKNMRHLSGEKTSMACTRSRSVILWGRSFVLITSGSVPAAMPPLGSLRWMLHWTRPNISSIFIISAHSYMDLAQTAEQRSKSFLMHPGVVLYN